ncbi:MAG: phage holin family protein [Peptostreptococcaceae bacterium]
MLKQFLINIILGALSIYIVSLGVNSIYIVSIPSLILLSIVLGFLNSTIKPLLKIFSLPITIVTLGLFSLVINAIVLKIAFAIVPGVHLEGFLPAIWASILLSICNWILYKIFGS